MLLNLVICQQVVPEEMTTNSIFVLQLFLMVKYSIFVTDRLLKNGGYSK